MNRPSSVTTFAVLSIVFGVLVTFCFVPYNGYTLATEKISDVDEAPPTIRQMVKSPIFKVWRYVAMPLDCLSGVWLLCIGAGMLKLRRWSRWAGLAYCVYGIGLGVLTGLVGLAASIPTMHNLSGAGDNEAVRAVTTLVGSALGGCCGAMIYPIALLIFLLGATARESLSR